MSAETDNSGFLASIPNHQKDKEEFEFKTQEFGNPKKEFGFKLLSFVLILIAMSSGEYVWVMNKFELLYIIPYLTGFSTAMIFFYITLKSASSHRASKHRNAIPTTVRIGMPLEEPIEPKPNTKNTNPRMPINTWNSMLSSSEDLFFPIIPYASLSLNYFAEQAPSSPLILAASPIDNQRRLGVDQSKGFREWEYYHRLSAGTDKDRGDSQFNGVLDGKIDLWDIPELKQTVSAQEERYARQFDIVDRLTRQVELHLKIMKQIDRKLSQKKLEGEA
jgi:hypothetical protein